MAINDKILNMNKTNFSIAVTYFAIDDSMQFN